MRVSEVQTVEMVVDNHYACERRMTRYLLGFLLAMTQLLAPVLGTEQAVLCVHPDGSAMVESGEELVECHAVTSQTDQASLTTPQCRDIAIPAHTADQQIVARRGSDSVPLPLFVAQIASRILLPAPTSYWQGIDPRLRTFLPHHSLESLSTVILTI